MDKTATMRYMGNERLDKHFRGTRYKDFMIYKNGAWWLVWDNEIGQTIILTKTLKEMIREIDKWKCGKAKNGVK